MSPLVLELLRQAETLTPEQQLDLAIRFTQMAQARLKSAELRPRRHWREIAGVAEPSLLGEDAQVWVSRTRADSDASRAANAQHP